MKAPRDQQLIPGRDYQAREGAQPNSNPSAAAGKRGSADKAGAVENPPGGHRPAPPSKNGGRDA